MKYFLAFDFYNRHINEFFYGIVTMDLSEDDVIEVAHQVIREKCPDINPLDVTIKVTALNNIET